MYLIQNICYMQYQCVRETELRGNSVRLQMQSPKLSDFFFLIN